MPIAGEAFQLETVDEGFAHDLVVLDQTNLRSVGGAHAAIGNLTVNTVWPGLLCASMRPRSWVANW